MEIRLKSKPKTVIPLSLTTTKNSSGLKNNSSVQKIERNLK